MDKQRQSPSESDDNAADRQRNDQYNQVNKGLPGDYPTEEDMMNRRDVTRVRADVEDFSRTTPLGTGDEIPSHQVVEDAIPDVVPVEKNGNESDVTPEDIEALGPRDLSMDMGEDENLLKSRVWPVDMAGADLDVPTGEPADDDLDEAIGPEDEENDFYSLGGDEKEDNMEGK